jgi:proteic killer suppression protein
MLSIRRLGRIGESLCVTLDVMSLTRRASLVIMSCPCTRTAAVFCNLMPKGFPTDVVAAARRKLAMLYAAVSLHDLPIPPSNRLEALRGGRAGQHGISVNGRWRMCFVWQDGHAHEVEIVDYH